MSNRNESGVEAKLADLLITITMMEDSIVKTATTITAVH
jgi:hypothetical protein